MCAYRPSDYPDFEVYARADKIDRTRMLAAFFDRRIDIARDFPALDPEEIMSNMAEIAVAEMDVDGYDAGDRE